MRTHAPRQSGPAENFSAVESEIQVVRGERAILDADLARLYGVPTKALKQAVRRNPTRFPPDFMLTLTRAEAKNLQVASHKEDMILRSQTVTLRHGRHVKHLPLAFTEHGALRAANVLKSVRAVQMSVFVVRAFVRIRSAMTDTRELARKLATLEAELTGRLDSHETGIAEFMRRIMQLLDPPPPPSAQEKELGFHTSMRRDLNRGPRP